MIKRMIIMVVLLAAVTAGFIGYKMYAMHQGMKAMSAGFAPPVVSTITASQQDWQPQLRAVGTVRAVNGADLSSEVSGIVEEIKFVSGTDVEAGALLVQLRAEDDIAKLEMLKASEKLAQINYARDEKQLKSQAISQATFDADVAALASAKANVNAQQAIIDKKSIRAPFAGHVGIRQVDVGQYLNPGATIVTLQQLDPIYIDFTLPEQAIPKLSLNQKVTIRNDSHSGHDFIGKISAINSKVDEATRNITIRAELNNTERKLLPGMFANVTIDAGETMHYVTLPQTAVVFNTYGNTIFLVEKNTGDESKPELSVKQSVIITGETRGDQIAVLSGVKDGDVVVTSGQIKLHNGAPVQINNSVQPSNDANPTPHE